MHNNPATKPLFRLLSPLACGFLTYLLVLLAFDTVYRVLDDFFNQELLVCIGMSYLMLEANRLIVILLQPKLMEGRHILWWSLLQLLLAFSLSALLTGGALILYFRYVEGMYSPASFVTEISVFTSIFLFISLLYQAYFMGFAYLHRQYRERMQSEEEKTNLLNRRIYHFHYAMHPDFLFTGLENVILKIREKQPEKAEEAIILLSRIYHYFLEQHEELAPLRHEIPVLYHLQQLLNQFGNNSLLLELTINEEDQLIIPATLIRLTEAISSSQLSSQAAPLTLRLYQEDTYLLMEFRPNPSLNRQDELAHILHSLQDQYAWLGSESFFWKEGEIFRIYIQNTKLVQA